MHFTLGVLKLVYASVIVEIFPKGEGLLVTLRHIAIAGDLIKYAHIERTLYALEARGDIIDKPLLLLT